MQFENVAFALTPAAYADLRAYLEAAARGQPYAGLSFGSKLPQNKASGNHVAVIGVHGLLMKNPSDWARKFGATSTADVQDQFETAMQDPNTHAVLLHVDSPGGTVDGTQSLADHIYNSRGRGKPIHALADGMCCSAAQWIASAAQKVFASTPTTQLGSIGVIATHVDASAAQGAAGYKVTEITSGPFKGLGSPNQPLGADGRAEMQRHIDLIHGEFAGHIARARGLSAEALSKVANGRVFLGREAVAHGLADGIKTFGEALAGLTAHAATARAPKPQPAAMAASSLVAGTGDLSLRARKYINDQAKLGRHVTACDAVRHVSTSP